MFSNYDFSERFVPREILRKEKRLSDNEYPTGDRISNLPESRLPLKLDILQVFNNLLTGRNLCRLDTFIFSNPASKLMFSKNFSNPYLLGMSSIGQELVMVKAIPLLTYRSSSYYGEENYYYIYYSYFFGRTINPFVLSGQRLDFNSEWFSAANMDMIEAFPDMLMLNDEDGGKGLLRAYWFGIDKMSDLLLKGIAFEMGLA